MISIQLHIDGMSCNGCARSIERRLNSTAGVASAAVDFRKGAADISYDEHALTQDLLEKAIEDLGFRVSSGS